MEINSNNPTPAEIKKIKDSGVNVIEMHPYKSSDTLQRFHDSQAFVRGVMGPYGSGKSSACCMELFNLIVAQNVFQGKRRSRIAIVRETYPELQTTTIKTWQDWFPEEMCPFKWTHPIEANMAFDLQDGTRVEAEIYFIALNMPKHVSKLLSLELTWLWINEAKQTIKEIFDAATGRVQRYPPLRLGGYRRSGVIMDTNPPDDDHWWYELDKVTKPWNYEFFQQPPAMLASGTIEGYVPNVGQAEGVAPAENVENLPAGWEYYKNLVQGKRKEWVEVFVMGMYGAVMDGKPVFPEYNDDIHCSKVDLEIFRGLPLLLGFDFGMTPACVIFQMHPNGQLRLLDELCAEYMSLEPFIKNHVNPFLVNHYAGMSMRVVGDPAGKQGSQADSKTCFQILAKHGLSGEMAGTNLLIPRRDAVVGFLQKVVGNGEPGFIMNARAKMVRRGFLGGYCFERLQVVGTEAKFKEIPKKNKFSHPADAVQYVCLEASGQGKNAGKGGQGARGHAREIVDSGYRE